MTAEKGGDAVRAVDRALDILLAFKPEDRQLTASDLLKRVDLSRPTLYRLLKTLELRGFVRAFGDPQQFQLGPAIAHLSHVWASGQDLTQAAQPMMRRLWEQTGETVALLVPQGQDRICVAEIPSAQALSFKRGVGHREKITLGASGKVILAFSPEAGTHLAALLPEHEQIAYRREISRIHDVGYAVSKDELIQGAVAIAAPFFAGNSKVLGSLAVYGPSARVDEARIAQIVNLLLAESRELSKVLGM